jgi:hypothetical protein
MIILQLLAIITFALPTAAAVVLAILFSQNSANTHRE